jgi:hypothetical protein
VSSPRSFWSTRALRAARAAAERDGREPDIVGLLRAWGSAGNLYRRLMTASPADKNREGIIQALEEAIADAQNLQPLAVQNDRLGHASGLRVRDAVTSAESTVVTRIVLIATGTVPNTVLAHEEPLVRLDGSDWRAYDESGAPISRERGGKLTAAHVRAHRAADRKSIGFRGDLHPAYAGTVVKAMAIAKNARSSSRVCSIASRAPPSPRRPVDRRFVGSVAQALGAYAARRLGTVPIAIGNADRIIPIGSEPMMAAARRDGLGARLRRGHGALASVSSRCST